MCFSLCFSLITTQSTSSSFQRRHSFSWISKFLYKYTLMHIYITTVVKTKNVTLPLFSILHGKWKSIVIFWKFCLIFLCNILNKGVNYFLFLFGAKKKHYNCSLYICVSFLSNFPISEWVHKMFYKIKLSEQNCWGK